MNHPLGAYVAAFITAWVITFVVVHLIIWLYDNNRPQGQTGPEEDGDKKAAQKVAKWTATVIAIATVMWLHNHVPDY